MRGVGAGFRVFDKHGCRQPGSPVIVVYRIDPVSLAYTEVSAEAERLLGYPALAWREPGFWARHLHPDDAAAGSALCRKWQAEPSDTEIEYRMIAADGRTVRVHDIVQVRTAPGQPPDIRGFMLDITGSVAGEADIQRALGLKNELFRIVSEELAQPVRSVAGFAQMLERHLAAQHDHVGSDYALGLQDGVQRLDQLLAQLMRAAQSNRKEFDEILRELASIRTGKRR